MRNTTEQLLLATACAQPAQGVCKPVCALPMPTASGRKRLSCCTRRFLTKATAGGVMPPQRYKSAMLQPSLYQLKLQLPNRRPRGRRQLHGLALQELQRLAVAAKHQLPWLLGHQTQIHPKGCSTALQVLLQQIALAAGSARPSACNLVQTLGQLRAVQGWESGSSSPKAKFLAHAAPIGVDVGYVITGSKTAGALTAPAQAPSSDTDRISIPLFSAKGIRGKGDELITEGVLIGEIHVSRPWLALNVPRFRPEALQLVHAYGSSMLGTLNSGDFAIVGTDCKVADIDGIYVLQANGQLFIKRVTRRIDGAHVITSDNPSVRTVDVLDGSQQVRICGRAIYGGNGRRFRRSVVFKSIWSFRV